MDTISFEEFKRLDLRVGRVEKVEDHPGADKLYILRINIGDRVIQTVAGLKPYMEKGNLEGRLVGVVVNLEPAMLRGVRSEGMILAAQSGDKVVLFVPESEIEPGAQIR